MTEEDVTPEEFDRRLAEAEPVEVDVRLRRGLYNRYEVTRLNDPDDKHADCRYFVLDPKHDPIARDVLALYADRTRRDGNEALAKSLYDWHDQIVMEEDNRG